MWSPGNNSSSGVAVLLHPLQCKAAGNLIKFCFGFRQYSTAYGVCRSAGFVLVVFAFLWSNKKYSLTGDKSWRDH